MNLKVIKIAVLFFVAFCTSCYVWIPQTDMHIINRTKDSLYYRVFAYNRVDDSSNMAYEKVTDEMTNKTTYIVPGYTIAPDDTATPSNNTKYNWKHYVHENNGLTILLYKRNIEKLPHNKPLTNKNIFRRMDFTAKQLDSLKYRIEIK